VVIFDLLPLTDEYIENNGQNNKNMSGCVKGNVLVMMKIIQENMKAWKNVPLAVNYKL